MMCTNTLDYIRGCKKEPKIITKNALDLLKVCSLICVMHLAADLYFVILTDACRIWINANKVLLKRSWTPFNVWMVIAECAFLVSMCGFSFMCGFCAELNFNILCGAYKFYRYRGVFQPNFIILYGVLYFYITDKFQVLLYL